MQLVAPLAAGVRGAENGTALLYRRGTSTLISYYTDFEATAAVAQSSSGVVLDSNGGATVYVDTMCNVVVKSSSGTTVRTFVAGVKDSSVEVISDSFTGADYVTGVSGASRPTTLQAVLDRWNDSAGTTNFQVLVGGVATNLQTAVQGVTGYFYNVKSSTYSAVGDGTVNDAASIQAAIDDADADGGGIVLMPAGTYRIESTLTIPQTVTLIGAGPHVTAISLDAASGSALTLTGTASTKYPHQIVGNFRLSQAQANTTRLISLGDPAVKFHKLYVTVGATGGKLMETSAATPTSYNVLIEDCYLSVASTEAVVLNASSSSSTFRITGSIVHRSATTWTSGNVFDVNCESLFDNNKFYMSTLTSTTGTRSLIRARRDAHVVGNMFSATGNAAAATYYALYSTQALATTSVLVYESGNFYGAGALGTYDEDALADINDQYFLGGRNHSWKQTAASSDTSFTIFPAVRSSWYMEKTSGATLDVAVDGGCPNGQIVYFTLWNNGTGGNVAITWGADFRATAQNVANNRVSTFQFICWGNILYQIGTPRDEVE